MTEYTKNAPRISDSTEPEELIEYARSCINNPVIMDGVYVFNFSSHEVDEAALKKAIKGKLQGEIYRIPFQVTSAQLFIQAIIPQRIREAEILIYREDEAEYYAYRNLLREYPIESQERIRQDFADLIK